LPTAFVLLNTEIGAESLVLKALRQIDGVTEAHRLWGVYDLIVHVKADSMAKLSQTITDHIERVGKVTSKLTLITDEKAPIHVPTHPAMEPLLAA
jgi:DNA-binding Lrp family transcriptional regulator